jgi:uncharacterized GH25 family protein
MKYLRAACVAMLPLFATALHAHDSWLVERDGSVGIVTGARYPRADLVPPPGSIARRDCNTSGGAKSCWMELREFDIVLEPKIVDVYFKDARPSDAVAAQWRGMLSENEPWRERYRKFARIELTTAATTGEQRASLRRPANLDLEILPLGGAALDTSAPARFVVLSKGEPVRAQPVELVSDRHPAGLWSRTDDRGEVEWRVPFAAHWLVRTILIEPDGAQAFRSRFATFAFEAR